MTKFTKSVIVINVLNIAFLAAFKAQAFFVPPPSIVPAMVAKDFPAKEVKTETLTVREFKLTDGTVCVETKTNLVCNWKK